MHTISLVVKQQHDGVEFPARPIVGTQRHNEVVEPVARRLSRDDNQLVLEPIGLGIFIAVVFAALGMWGNPSWAPPWLWEKLVCQHQQARATWEHMGALGRYWATSHQGLSCWPPLKSVSHKAGCKPVTEAFSYRNTEGQVMCTHVCVCA